MKNIKHLFLLIASLSLLNACATHPSGPSEQEAELEKAQTTHIDISYSLGHNEHRLVADGTAADAQVFTYLEKDIVESGKVAPAKYISFVSKALTFVHKPRRAPSEQSECRSPFSISVKIDEKTYTSSGCRSSEESGGLSKLVRDGEFLLYSKK